MVDSRNWDIGGVSLYEFDCGFFAWPHARALLEDHVILNLGDFVAPKLTAYDPWVYAGFRVCPSDRLGKIADFGCRGGDGLPEFTLILGLQNESQYLPEKCCGFHIQRLMIGWGSMEMEVKIVGSVDNLLEAAGQLKQACGST